MTKTTSEERPAIYVGTYGKYNSGSIAGKWLYPDEYSDWHEFYEACKELHKNEHDPEFMFQDWEYIPSAYICESSISEKFWDEYVCLDDDERDMLKAYQDHHDPDASLEQAQDACMGVYDSGADYAEQIYEETISGGEKVPDWVCVDWEATWNCNLRFDYFTAPCKDGGKYIFSQY